MIASITVLSRGRSRGMVESGNRGIGGEGGGGRVESGNRGGGRRGKSGIGESGAGVGESWNGGIVSFGELRAGEWTVPQQLNNLTTYPLGRGVGASGRGKGRAPSRKEPLLRRRHRLRRECPFGKLRAGRRREDFTANCTNEEGALMEEMKGKQKVLRHFYPRVRGLKMPQRFPGMQEKGEQPSSIPQLTGSRLAIFAAGVPARRENRQTFSLPAGPRFTRRTSPPGFLPFPKISSISGEVFSSHRPSPFTASRSNASTSRSVAIQTAFQSPLHSALPCRNGSL